MSTLSDIISAVTPFIIDALKGALVHSTPTKPAPTPPIVPSGTTAYPHDFVKVVQTFVNKVLSFIDPSATQLKVDGWVGQKTTEAINLVIAYATSHGLK